VNILHIVPNFHPFVGGIERIVQDLTGFQKENDDNPTVIFPDRLNKFQDEYFVDDVRVIPFHFPKLVLPLFLVGMPINQSYSTKSIVKIFASCRNILTDLKPDIIHVHGASEIAVPMINIAKSIGIKVIFHAHQEYLDSNLKPVEMKLLSMIDHVICVSDAVRKSIQVLISSDTRVSVVLNGIPINQMQQLIRITSSNKIVMAGRFFPEKGFDLGIKSFKRVSDKYPEISLCILGNGPERRFLESLVRDLNLQNAIQLPGVANRSKLMSEMVGALCVVIPTPESEAFGLLALESMSVGTPVIATRVGGLPEIIKDGINGLLVEPEIQEIADAIERIYLDKKLAKKMALKGQEVVRNQFSMARFANQIREEYLIALKK